MQIILVILTGTSSGEPETPKLVLQLIQAFGRMYNVS